MFALSMSVYRAIIPTGLCRRFCSINELKNVGPKEPHDATALSVHCNDDLSQVTPYFPKTFNVAAYVNKSDTLQKLISLNVNLSKIEMKPYIMHKFIKLDFEKDIKKHIFFLNDYVAVDKIGDFITKNPLIFFETIDNLQVRINYLISKKFDNNQIQNIITRNPFWLMLSTTRIDKRLGFFQTNFKLTGTEVKQLASTQPRLITYNVHHIKTNTFLIKEEMGFTDEELKSMLLFKPRLWMINQLSLKRRFDYIHNVIKIPHEDILKCPNILLCREFKIKQRYTFLQKLGRAQFDPKKENYVPLIALAERSDVDFCKDFAKCTVDDFNLFLKTL